MGWEPPGEVIGDLRDESPSARLSARLQRWRKRWLNRDPDGTLAPDPGGDLDGDRDPNGDPDNDPHDGSAQPRRRTLRLITIGFTILVLVALAVVAARAAGGPARPVLTVVSGSSPEGFWPSDAGGRPGPVVLEVTADVRRSAGTDTTLTQVLGLTGPGVVRSDDPDVSLTAGSLTQVPLYAVLDCDQLPAAEGGGTPVKAATTALSSDFGLRVRTTQGTGASTAVVSTGSTGRRWLAQARTGCAAWYARRDLTVTAVHATVHPIAPRVDLTLTLRNNGTRAATLSRTTGPQIRLLGALPASIPPDSTRTVTLSVLLDRCDSIERPLDDGTSPLTPEPTLSTIINLAALAGPPGPASTVPADSVQDEGLGPTGVVLDRVPGQTLNTALNQACAYMGPISPLISPGAVTYDRATRILTVPMAIDVEPGRVRYAAVAPEQPTDDLAHAYRPIWTTYLHVVPDRTGQLRVVLRYRTPTSGPCPAFGSYIPGFVATLHVPVRGGERVLTYGGSVDVVADRTALTLICPPAALPSSDLPFG